MNISSNQPLGHRFNFRYYLVINHSVESELILYILNRGTSNSNSDTRIQY